jgi:hypothetical protein
MKFPGGAFAQYDIIERGKKGENDLALGKELCIENQTFEDLEDIRWNFVSPIKQKLSTLVAHRRWLEDKETAKEMLIKAFHDNPGQMPYELTIDPKVQNCAIFLWLGHGKIWEEPIRLRPEDWMWRHQAYPTIDKVINEWKQRGRHEAPTTGPRPIDGKRTEREEKLEQERTRGGSWPGPRAEIRGFGDAHGTRYAAIARQ